MAKLPDKMQYGIVAINGFRLPVCLQIPFIVADMKIGYPVLERNSEATAEVSIKLQITTERRKTVQGIALLLSRIYGFVTDFCGIEHPVDVQIGQIEKPRDIWIINTDRLAIRIGGSEIFGFQFSTKKHRVTFYGYEGWKDSQDHICLGRSGAVSLFGFLLTWATYGKRKNRAKGNLCFYRHGWKWDRRMWGYKSRDDT